MNNNQLPFRTDGIYVRKMDKESELEPKPTTLDKWISKIKKEVDVYYQSIFIHEDSEYLNGKKTQLKYIASMSFFYGELFNHLNELAEKYTRKGYSEFYNTSDYEVSKILGEKIFLKNKKRELKGQFFQNKEFFIMYGPKIFVFIPFDTFNILTIPKGFIDWDERSKATQ